MNAKEHLPEKTVSHIEINSAADIVAARQKGRSMAQAMGFTGSDPTLIATAISEIARNIVEYAGKGELSIENAHKNGKTGLIITARDEGPGILDIHLALQDGYSTRKSLGLGLPGARRLMDDFQIHSEAGKGTTVIMQKWLK